MQKSIFTAVFALLLIGSLSACSTTAAVPGNHPHDTTASYHSSMERNGVHSGSIDESWHERLTTLGDPYYQGSQNESLNSPNGRTLSKDIQTTGEKVISGTENAAKDVTNGLQNAGKNVTNGVREAGRDLERGADQVERDVKNTIDKNR